MMTAKYKRLLALNILTWSGIVIISWMGLIKQQIILIHLTVATLFLLYFMGLSFHYECELNQQVKNG